MNMFCILSIDPSSLGKVDKHSFSQQTLMELFIEGFTENKEKICRDADAPKDISEWMGVKLNESKEVVNINWHSTGLKGTVSLQWLPFAVRKVFFCSNKLSGTVDLTCLPDGLKVLSLWKNCFEGTVDLTHLPAGMTNLYLYDNRFVGKTDFGHLPKSLQTLNVASTQLEGEIFVFAGDGLDMEHSKVIDMRNKK